MRKKFFKLDPMGLSPQIKDEKFFKLDPTGLSPQIKGKRFFMLFACALLLCLLSACGEVLDKESGSKTPVNKTTRWDIIMKSGVLKVGVRSLDDSFDNDLLDAFAKELTAEVKKVALDWSNKENALNNGEVDMLWGQIPDTSENSVSLSLSLPHVKGTTILAAKKDRQGDPVNIGVLDSTADYDVAKSHFKEIEKYTTLKSLFDALNSGKTDAAAINKDIYDNAKNINKQNLEIINEYEYSLVFEFRNNENDVKNEVEKIMAKIKGDNTASEISEKWYNKDLIIK